MAGVQHRDRHPSRYGPPTVTDLLGAKIGSIPIPFLDLTPYLGNVLQAALLASPLHLGSVLAGLPMPFWAVVGPCRGDGEHLRQSSCAPSTAPLGGGHGHHPHPDRHRHRFLAAFGIGITLAITSSLYQLLLAAARPGPRAGEVAQDYPAPASTPIKRPSQVRAGASPGAGIQPLGPRFLRVPTLTCWPRPSPDPRSTGLLTFLLIVLSSPLMSVVSARRTA